MTQDYKQHWDEKFRAQEWGRYPPEDLVRFCGRHYKNTDRNSVKVLEIGCGPGANIWFLHREGFDVSGIDGSPSAIDQAYKRVSENAALNKHKPDLKVGDFSKLPWKDHSFDVVIDIFSLYANTSAIIDLTLKEVFRVLKPNGRFYSKLWGRDSTGYGSGVRLEDGTYDKIESGPCRDMGVSHFFDKPEIERVFKDFNTESIDEVLRTDRNGSVKIQEFHCQFTKTKL